jgi:hypothetical protein
VNPVKPTSDGDIEAAVRAEIPWLLERRQDCHAAAMEETVSGRLRRAVAAMGQPYEQVAHSAEISFAQLVDFMAGGSLPSDGLDRLAAVARCELVTRD